MTHTTTCPPWCDVSDHDDWDRGETLHHRSRAVPLSALPCGMSSERDHEHTDVALQQRPGSDPVILIDTPLPPGSRYREIPMTLGEAAQIRDLLTELITAAQHG
jgi:hypothetical protein